MISGKMIGQRHMGSKRNTCVDSHAAEDLPTSLKITGKVAGLLIAVMLELQIWSPFHMPD